MKVTCSLCGKVEEISKLHKDYRKIAENKDTIFICPTCEIKTKKEALKSQEG